MSNSVIPPDDLPITDPDHIPSTPNYAPPPLGGTIAVTASRTIAGPIPASDEMAGYAHVSADLPDRIMAMAEKNSESERVFRRRIQTFQLLDSLTQRIFALIAFVVAMFTVYELAVSGHDGPAIAVGGSTAALVVGGFLGGAIATNPKKTSKEDTPSTN